MSVLVGCFAVFALLYGVEMDLGRWNREIRLVRSVSETTTRYLAIAHFLLAFVFLASSRRMRAARPWVPIAALALVGGTLCVGWDWLRGRDEYLARLLFFAYFVAHDVRDQIFFYDANGDAPASVRRKDVAEALFLVAFLPAAVLAALVAALKAGGVIGGSLAPTGAALPSVLGAAFLALPLAVAAFALRLRHLVRRGGLGSVRRLVAEYRPLFRVFALNAAVLFFGLVLSGHMYAIVVLHVTGWYIFTWRQLGRRSAGAPAPGSFTWAWMRTTPAGFTLLHGGLVVLLVAAGTVWAYAFRNDPGFRTFAFVLGQGSFPLWTIVHVTISFGSR